MGSSPPQPISPGRGPRLTNRHRKAGDAFQRSGPIQFAILADYSRQIGGIIGLWIGLFPLPIFRSPFPLSNFDRERLWRDTMPLDRQPFPGFRQSRVDSESRAAIRSVAGRGCVRASPARVISYFSPKNQRPLSSLLSSEYRARVDLMAFGFEVFPPRTMISLYSCSLVNPSGRAPRTSWAILRSLEIGFAACSSISLCSATSRILSNSTLSAFSSSSLSSR